MSSSSDTRTRSSDDSSAALSQHDVDGSGVTGPQRPPEESKPSSSRKDDGAAPPDVAPAAASTPKRVTPAMQQYQRFKEQHPDCVLFFRMGDFYEMFHDDALLCHRVLGITLTQRSEGVPMAGVPYHAVESYLRRMIEGGYRVAVCDQVQDPREAKGVVDRAVTRVLTPGTLVDESLLEDGRANQVAAIAFTGSGDDSPAVAAVAELSTGALLVHDLPAGRVADELARIAPSELLYVETADGDVPPRVEAATTAIECALTARPAWTFRVRDAGDLVREHFGLSTLTGLGFDDDSQLVAPIGALLRYLLETQSPAASADRAPDAESADPDAPRPLMHLQRPRLARVDDHLIIDAASLASLEIERTIRSGQSQGSLLSVFASCHTPMGRRMIRRWLCFPLRSVEQIEQRQFRVRHLVGDRDGAASLSSLLGNIQDVARITGRIAMARATPRDIVALGRSTSKLTALIDWLEQREPFAHLRSELTELASKLTPLAKNIERRCVDEPPAHLRAGGLFRDGVDSELDEARLLQRDAASWLVAYQQRLVEQTGIASLKVGFNRVFGYYIEVSHANAAKTPDTFTRKQTLKNAERYITGELKEFEDKITTAESRAIEREKTMFERLCRQAAAHIEGLSRFGEIVGEIDVLTCFADTAARLSYVQPTMVDQPVLNIRQGRHAVLDRTLGERFVPNDCLLGPPTAGPNESSERDTEPAMLALITGPNMAGKSTYIRQVAIITLLAHTGSFVPAEYAVIGLTDRIFTRIGASDELHAGQSTFMVEMVETAGILHHATERSLVILDEIGRGTSTLDGLSLAWAIAESLADVGCRTLFATHYHELTELAERLNAVGNLHVAVREWGEQIIFLYRILPGRTDRSYGIHVAQIAGVPPRTIARARELLDTLAVHTEPPTIPDDLKPPPGERPPMQQMGLFTEYVEHPAMKQLRLIDVNQLTPLDAFDALRRLSQMIEPADTDGVSR